MEKEQEEWAKKHIITIKSMMKDQGKEFIDDKQRRNKLKEEYEKTAKVKKHNHNM